MSGNEIVIGILNFLVTAGIVTFALKIFIGKYIESEFKKRLDTHQASLEVLKEHQNWLQETQRLIYPELNTLVYHSWNSAKEIIERNELRHRYGSVARECAKYAL